MFARWRVLLSRRSRVLAGVATGIVLVDVVWVVAGPSSIHPLLFIGVVSVLVLVVSHQLVVGDERLIRIHDLETTVRERTTDLEQTLEELRAANVRQEQFVAHVSHELFTPLTTIVGTMNMLSEPDTVSVSEIPRVVELAARSSERMAQLVDDLMLATGLTGVIDCERVPFDLAAQVRSALEGFEPFGKTVETQIVDGTGALGDAARFRTAFRQLLSNADKFAPLGSTIRIDGHNNGNGVAVVVRDEGPGIALEHREAVFERFRHFDGAVSRQHEGLGLGLFVARQTMRAMDGDVTVEDISDGCAVRISLPRGELRAARFGRKGVATAVAAGLVLFSGSALAATGHLPAPVQNAIARAAALIGIDIPHSDVSAADSGDGLSAEEAREFVQAKKEWTACVAEAARSHGGASFDPDEACGDEPQAQDFGPGEVGNGGDADALLPGVKEKIPAASVPDVAENSGDGGSAGDVGDAVGDVGGSSGNAPDAVGQAANDAGNAAGDAGDKVQDTTEDASNEVDEEVEDTSEDLKDTLGGLVKP